MFEREKRNGSKEVFRCRKRGCKSRIFAEAQAILKMTINHDHEYDPATEAQMIFKAALRKKTAAHPHKPGPQVMSLAVPPAIDHSRLVPGKKRARSACSDCVS